MGKPSNHSISCLSRASVKNAGLEARDIKRCISACGQLKEGQHLARRLQEGLHVSNAFCLEAWTIEEGHVQHADLSHAVLVHFNYILFSQQRSEPIQTSNVAGDARDDQGNNSIAVLYVVFFSAYVRPPVYLIYSSIPFSDIIDGTAAKCFSARWYKYK